MQPDVERYLNIRSAYGATLSGSGDDLRVSFLMDTTGTPQAWELTEPGAWPEQRTFFDERVTFLDASPAEDRHELAFGMDEGGNERAQLYRLDADGTVTDLTATPEAKHRWGGWDSAGERFAFASNRRDESVFDLYVQARDETGDDAELVHEGDGWLSLSGWSPDDATLAVHEAHSSFDHDVYAFDLDARELTHLTPHEGDVRYAGLSWGPDGDLYCVTDEGADTMWLARLSTEGDDDLDLVAEGGEWNVDGVAVDEDTGRLVYSRNVDGYTELTVGDLTDGGLGIDRLPEPDLPRGVAGGVSFDDDAERFAVTVTGDTTNTNVHVVDAETGASRRWTRASTAGIPPESFRGSELIRYETFDGREIPAFVTLPEGVGGYASNGGDEDENGNGNGNGNGNADDQGVPVIVDIHGGPESQRRPSFNGLKQYFLASGYATFEPNVRGSTGYGKAYTHLDDVEKRMDSVKDLRAGVEWLHDHPAVADDRIVALGGSYGGFMVLAALTEYPDLWAAGVDVVGIANFVTFLENTGPWRRSLREAEYGSLEEDRELLESISPINRIDRVRAPLFVIHGENDPRVPVGEARQVAEAAGEHVPVETLIFEDEGHGLSKLENRVEAYTRVVAFLDEHV